MSRRWTRRALLLLFTALFTIAALEGALRLVARVVAARRDDLARATNAALVVYGDSTPYGLGNTVQLSGLLARELGLPVGNRSWPGLNSTQVAHLVHDDLARTSPRVLIVTAGVNDAWNLEDVPGALLGDAARMRRWLPRLRTVRLLTLGFAAGLGGYGIESSVASGWSLRDATARLLPASAIRRIQSASFASITSDAAAHGAKVLYLGYQAEGYAGVGDLAEDVLRAEHGDELVPVRDLFVDGGGHRRMLQEDHFHPDDDGQRAIAGRVVEALRARGWIDALTPPVGPAPSPLSALRSAAPTTMRVRIPVA